MRREASEEDGHLRWRRGEHLSGGGEGAGGAGHGLPGPGEGVAAAQQAAGQEEIRCGQHGVRGGAGHPGRVQAAVTSDLMKGK